MQLDHHSEHEISGTKIGAAISLAIILVFGVTSLVAQQEDTSHNGSNRTNSAVAISAYLA